MMTSEAIIANIDKRLSKMSKEEMITYLKSLGFEFKNESKTVVNKKKDYSKNTKNR